MGFFTTLFKTTLTADSKYIKRYDSANLFKGVIVELCNNHGYKAYLLSSGKKQQEIDLETDISNTSIVDLEIDYKENTKTIYVGLGPSESIIRSKMRNGIISQTDYIKLYNWSISEALSGYFESSFDILRWIKQKEEYMIQNQRSALGL